MHYLQRLIKRTMAKQSSSKQEQTADPFSRVEVEEAQWPRSNTQTGAPQVEPAPTEQTISNVTTSTEDQTNQAEKVREIPQIKTPLETPKKNIVEPPDKNVPENPIKFDAKTSPLEEEEETRFLNQDRGLSIMDQIMEPFIKSVNPDVVSQKELEPAEPSKMHKIEEEPNSDRKRFKHPETSKSIEKLPSDEKEKPAQVYQLTPEIIPAVKTNSIKKTTNQESEEKYILTKKILEEQFINRKKTTENIHHENKIIVVNNNSKKESDSEDNSCGSPHIGLGQL